MIASELVKIKRTRLWIVCLCVPLLSVVLGTLNFLGNTDQLTNGWDSYSSQTGLFYALVFFSVGSSVIVSTVWSADFRTSNWNLISSCYRSGALIFVAKGFVSYLAIVVMHLLYMLLTLGVAIALSIDGIQVGSFLAVNCLVFAIAAPFAAFQGFLSFATRNFSWPVGISVLLCASGFLVVTGETLASLRFVIPQALGTYTLALSSAAFKIQGNLLLNGLGCVLFSILQSAVFLCLSVWLLRHRNARA
ncbi:hypothetical protein EML15_09475 [Corynebacterium sp. sy017]|uniref:ABC transporter permease n=1 Tax=unclassified Corynebacterium TaxID=2624378 RepID=UPI001184A7E9|nr:MULTISPECIES: ABC transporter permease [unclassified Corynebacterium]MBP3089368.1 hypothetical protein [Corynebacterium sp. sy017]TSD90938.1 hypothetical protein ELY17_09125 [Corynebacterium sp. SY003]